VEGGEPEDIAAAIYRKKDAGCGTYGNTSVTYSASAGLGTDYTYRILRPTVTALGVQVVFARALSDAEEAAVRAAIIADAEGENTLPRIGLAQRLYASRFWGAISGATDTPLASVKVRLGTSGTWLDSVTINADVEPAVSDESIEIETEA
jgi:hypothetical protein